MTDAVRRLFKAATLTLLLITGCSDLGEPLPGSQTLSSHKLNIGLVTVGFTGEKILTITNGGPGTLTGTAVIKADSSGKFGLIGGGSYSLGIDESLNLTVSFTPDSASLTKFGAWLVLESNDTSTMLDSVEILGEGTLTLLADLAVSASSLNFGTLAPDQSDTTVSLTISSMGALSATISAISVTGTGFSIPALAYPFALAVGTDTTLGVTFTPPALGSYSGTLTITANSQNSPVAVSLAGNQASPVSFAASIKPLLTGNCGSGNCHLNGKSQAGLSLETYASLMTGSSGGAVVLPGDGAGSLIIRKLRGTAGSQMPNGAAPLPDADISNFEFWIDQGALDN